MKILCHKSDLATSHQVSYHSNGVKNVNISFFYFYYNDEYIVFVFDSRQQRRHNHSPCAGSAEGTAVCIPPELSQVLL